MRALIFTYLILLSFSSMGQAELFGHVKDLDTEQGVSFAKVSLHSEESYFTITDEFGRFYFQELKEGSYRIKVRSLGFEEFDDTLSVLRGTNNFEISIEDTMELDKVDIFADNSLSSRNMRTIEGMMLTHGKKTHLIELGKMIGNKANNNARELFA